MKQKFLKYSAIVAGIAIFLLTSCNELDLTPTNKFTEENYWTSAEKANMVLNMAYSQMTNSDYIFKTESLSDNLYEGRGSSSEKAISSGQADASNGRFSGEWRDCYAGIKTCHTFLENVDRVPDMNEALKTRMKAEARLIVSPTSTPISLSRGVRSAVPQRSGETYVSCTRVSKINDGSFGF